MKIVEVSPYAIGRPGGVQTHIRDLRAWLIEQGHEVRVLAPPGPPIEGVTQIGRCRTASVHGTSFELTHATRAELRSCVAELQTWGAEVVHLHTPWVPMLGWQVWRRLNLPTVATFHATLPEDNGPDPVSWFLRRVAGYFNKRVSAVVVPSDGPRAQWIAAGANPVPGIMPPTINLSRWRGARIEKADETAFNVICLGRLEERKGLFVLLEAWKQVSASLPHAHLTIAGNGSLEQAIRQRIESDALPRVSLLSAPPHEAAPALVAGADAFVAAALGGESFGLVLIEAMAAGVVPVASDNAGFASVLTGPGADLLFPVGDAGALASRLVALAQDRARLVRMRNWAMHHADQFDVTRIGPDYVRLFQSALG
ncbi:glycosyltransferase family 4 protein [Shimia biformata]|uniref:glycosyltransferase family 4 protein n=1 Tax=Shimia biformata TaxID=1294299 RepID=UPI00195114B3|nr:glycosyltransferase family 4 protein [Shimia biformata]